MIGKSFERKTGSNDLKFEPIDSRPTLHPYDDFYWMPTTRNLDPVIVDLPYTPMTISTGCQIVHLDQRNAKVLSSKLNPFGFVKLNGFHDNL